MEKSFRNCEMGNLHRLSSSGKFIISYMVFHVSCSRETSAQFLKNITFDAFSPQKVAKKATLGKIEGTFIMKWK